MEAEKILTRKQVAPHLHQETLVLSVLSHVGLGNEGGKGFCDVLVNDVSVFDKSFACGRLDDGVGSVGDSVWLGNEGSKETCDVLVNGVSVFGESFACDRLNDGVASVGDSVWFKIVFNSFLKVFGNWPLIANCITLSEKFTNRSVNQSINQVNSRFLT